MRHGAEGKSGASAVKRLKPKGLRFRVSGLGFRGKGNKQELRSGLTGSIVIIGSSGHLQLLQYEEPIYFWSCYV